MSRNTEPGRSAMVASGHLEILKPGMLSQLQDVGRIGALRYGVSHSGVMDPYSAAWANRLVRNRMDAPLIEVALGGLQLRAAQDTWLAIAGAAIPAYLDGREVDGWSRFLMREGQVLSLGFAAQGQRAYIAVQGGFVVEPVLGSTATHQRNRLGGPDGSGSPLQRGNLLPCVADAAAFRSSASAQWQQRTDFTTTPVLRVLLGGDALRFAEDQRARFFDTHWEVSRDSDRMGVRLHHDMPLQEIPTRTLSLGITPGTIQIPPSGNPIVLMSDCQTMGGYPVLGWLHPLDRGRLAQVPARQTVRFVASDIETLQTDMQRFADFFAVLP
ncbi:biotin-dependent carboxyltransferase family protein [Carnimonas nigrificans]|uniref:5-oxoprolinase subunit C family protein n=1 Tax=Carnimonas nigrificans TaxID=64323 RepID=UPI001B7F9C00|nr:biotin-dependent carboxyltransferase family protein [Carnimonas nigrificans]